MLRPMKHSGVEWLGDIPADWDVVNIRKLFSFGKGLPITKEDLRESGLPVISYGQIHSKFNSGTTITSELIRFVDDDYLQSYSQSLVKCGDFIFADTSEDLAGCGNCVYVDTDERIFAGYHTIILRNKTCSQMKYFAFLFQSDAWRKQIRERVTGVKLFSISQKILRATSVIIPPPDEQQRIASFLDDKCARIDSVIEKTRASVEEYKKLKQALITRAVTKGIRPNRPMKQSGVEWLGDIPADWKIGRIGQLYTERKEKVSDVDFPPLSVTMKGILPQLSTAAKSDAHDDRKLVRKGDFAINSRSDRRGSCGISPYDGSVSLINIILTPRNEMNPVYYDWLFHSTMFADEFYKWGHGIVDDLWTTNWQDMKKISVPFPPLEEQKEIAQYLDEKTATIDSLVAKKNQLAEELTSLKKSLIFEYVTGKKEVPT